MVTGSVGISSFFVFMCVCVCVCVGVLCGSFSCEACLLSSYVLTGQALADFAALGLFLKVGLQWQNLNLILNPYI